MDTTERRGAVEIRWKHGDPDDVVASTPVQIHVERMSDGDVWMAIYDPTTDKDVHMWLRAKRKGELEWTVRPD